MAKAPMDEGTPRCGAETSTPGSPRGCEMPVKNHGDRCWMHRDGFRHYSADTPEPAAPSPEGDTLTVPEGERRDEVDDALYGYANRLASEHDMDGATRINGIRRRRKAALRSTPPVQGALREPDYWSVVEEDSEEGAHALREALREVDREVAIALTTAKTRHERVASFQRIRNVVSHALATTEGHDDGAA